jgi:hypothetical protein
MGGILILWNRTALDTSTVRHLGDGGRTLSPPGCGSSPSACRSSSSCCCAGTTDLHLPFTWQVARLDLRLVPTHPDRLWAWLPLAHAHGLCTAGAGARGFLAA